MLCLCLFCIFDISAKPKSLYIKSATTNLLDRKKPIIKSDNFKTKINENKFNMD